MEMCGCEGLGLGQRGGEGRVGKRQGGSLVVMELFCILSLSMMTFSLWYYTTVLQDVTIRENGVKGIQQDLWIICESRTICELSANL